ncbi:hypothetical protein VT84_02095 [Gemmata sp. SH-PL17]|uniref:hypothetical protein n=1 Tax=Gemmata sp. SH-PL17 TaxID=1630693 RepID=UPI00078C2D01|nr:hypothetical protein [Gemmata sp. SH-PL17]AMV23173.1 hypothetical protein VT84_02095 [Gemmata sp. SH-PL17]
MPRHLILPKDAFEDFRSLLALRSEQLEALVSFFATAESVTSVGADAAERIAAKLGIDYEAARNIVFVCTFLLSVVEDGRPAEEVLLDVKAFTTEYIDQNDKQLLGNFDKYRPLYLSLLTPTTERLRAQKVQYLEDLRPKVTSFRTVCELRPVFETRESEEQITGLIPIVSLVVEMTESDRVILHLSPAQLKNLREVVARADKKIAALQTKFGTELLTSANEDE